LSTQSDKGRVTVCLGKKTYNEAMEKLFSDKLTYKMYEKVGGALSSRTSF